ncbi:lytic transglycosylase domain-containing protein [Roseivirga sp. BDSF3-8]|uniref:lytic transglycosylase domain-containing protein n=1 Tax=Roseivirga sp. BDSF3-8 TaxID=3241598 RepID=UPI0035321E99
MKGYLIVAQWVLIAVLFGVLFYNSGSGEIAESPSQPVDYQQVPLADKPFDIVNTYDLPDNLTFAGEVVPLEDPDVRERLDREIYTNLYYHSSTISILKSANRWMPAIEKILAENNIPDDFKYLALIESGLKNVVSPAGATGFWQLRDITAKELGLEVNVEVDQRYDPIKSTEAAAKYLNKSYAKFGSWTNAAASYNIGMYGLDKRLKDQRVISYYDLLLNEETSRYLFRALALKEIYENRAKYGYDFPSDHMYGNEDLRVVTIDHDVKNFVDYAIDLGINYKILKQYNPWLRGRSLTVSKGNSYQILVPRNPPQFTIRSMESEESNYAESKTQIATP